MRSPPTLATKSSFLSQSIDPTLNRQICFNICTLWPTGPLKKVGASENTSPFNTLLPTLAPSVDAVQSKRQTGTHVKHPDYVTLCGSGRAKALIEKEIGVIDGGVLRGPLVLDMGTC